MSPGNPRGCSQTVLNRLHVPLVGYSSGCCLQKQLESTGRHFCVVFCVRRERQNKQELNFRVLVLAFVKTALI
jgi:hypothetical protein